MRNTLHFVVDADRVTIRFHSSCGSFRLSELPRDWRDQFTDPCVHDAILAELQARECADAGLHSRARHHAEHGIAMSWYSVRARLLPDRMQPLSETHAARDGRGACMDTMTTLRLDASMLAVRA